MFDSVAFSTKLITPESTSSVTTVVFSSSATSVALLASLAGFSGLQAAKLRASADAATNSGNFICITSLLMTSFAPALRRRVRS